MAKKRTEYKLDNLLTPKQFSAVSLSYSESELTIATVSIPHTYRQKRIITDIAKQIHCNISQPFYITPAVGRPRISKDRTTTKLTMYFLSYNDAVMACLILDSSLNAKITQQGSLP